MGDLFFQSLLTRGMDPFLDPPSFTDRFVVRNFFTTLSVRHFEPCHQIVIGIHHSCLDTQVSGYFIYVIQVPQSPLTTISFLSESEIGGNGLI